MHMTELFRRAELHDPPEKLKHYSSVDFAWRQQTWEAIKKLQPNDLIWVKAPHSQNNIAVQFVTGDSTSPDKPASFLVRNVDANGEIFETRVGWHQFRGSVSLEERARLVRQSEERIKLYRLC